MLYRINACSEPFEEAFAAAAIPYQVRDGAFGAGPRRAVLQLKRSSSASVAEAVEAITDPARLRPGSLARRRRGGHAPVRSRPHAFPRSGVRARPVSGGGGVRRRAHRRFSTEHSGRGEPAHLSPSEGLEFGGVPATARRAADMLGPLGPGQGRPEEERRLLYVGSRARTPVPLPHLAGGRPRAAEPFLDEMELAPSVPSRPKAAPGAAVTVGRGGALFDRLKEWRRKARDRRRRARLRRVPRPDARRDRRASVQGLGRSRRDLGRGTRQARTLRGRGAGRRGGRLTRQDYRAGTSRSSRRFQCRSASPNEGASARVRSCAAAARRFRVMSTADPRMTTASEAQTNGPDSTSATGPLPAGRARQVRTRIASHSGSSASGPWAPPRSQGTGKGKVASFSRVRPVLGGSTNGGPI